MRLTVTRNLHDGMKMTSMFLVTPRSAVTMGVQPCASPVGILCLYVPVGICTFPSLGLRMLVMRVAWEILKL